ncbi:hypothetical protein [Levilactobacillus zymae]|uniref:hypothetical protein n=1 Tax=Levilactobacillus zymae TaxID=267363 RepID=UPI0028B55D6B|nr:hypothetical protein [Levilactobacillus zymae]MDT6980569.1 hypothetical protein [Levilactobacillus zymae]
MHKLSTILGLVVATGFLGTWALTTDTTPAVAAKWPTVSLYDKSIYDSQGNFKDWHAYDDFGGTSLKLLAPSNYNYKGYRRQSKAAFSSRYKYKVANPKGNMFRVSGPDDINREPYIANTKLKVTHHLKNYKHTTWTRTKYTFIKHRGKWQVYYFVKSKKHVSGWVKLTDLRLISPKQKRISRARLLKDPDRSYEVDQVYRLLTTRERNEYAGNTSYMCDAGVDGDVPRDVMYSDFYLSRK